MFSACHLLRSDRHHPDSPSPLLWRKSDSAHGSEAGIARDHREDRKYHCTPCDHHAQDHPSEFFFMYHYRSTSGFILHEWLVLVGLIIFSATGDCNAVPAQKAASLPNRKEAAFCLCLPQRGSPISELDALGDVVLHFQIGRASCRERV